MAGRLITITGPSGTGKSTMCKHLMRVRPTDFSELISVTTRDPRTGEREGLDYYYVSALEFDALEREGQLAESIRYNQTSYGLTKSEVASKLSKFPYALVVVEPAGAKALRTLYKKAVKSVLILSEAEVLRERMLSRGDSPESVERRLSLDAEHFDVNQADYDIVIDGTSLSIEEMASQLCVSLHVRRKRRN